LLAFSRRQPLAPKSLDINALIKGVADLLHRTLGETVAFESVASAALWRAMADQGELENVLINLAVNARDAMPNGGKLTIETGNASLDEAYIASITEPVSPGQYVLIAVSDTGSGLTQEECGRLFTPYYTTKQHGTGLGLAIVQSVVSDHGGKISVESTKEKETTFRIELPRESA